MSLLARLSVSKDAISQFLPACHIRPEIHFGLDWTGVARNCQGERSEGSYPDGSAGIVAVAEQSLSGLEKSVVLAAG
jgi:hypothetical protein